LRDQCRRTFRRSFITGLDVILEFGLLVKK
jgi:hypothetical protein